MTLYFRVLPHGPAISLSCEHSYRRHVFVSFSFSAPGSLMRKQSILPLYIAVVRPCLRVHLFTFDPPTIHITNFLRKISALTYTSATPKLSGVLAANISRSLEYLFCIFQVCIPPRPKISHVGDAREAVKRQRMVPNSIDRACALFIRLHGPI